MVIVDTSKDAARADVECLTVLTPALTHDLLVNALPDTQWWATVYKGRMVGAPFDPGDPVTDWSKLVVEDESHIDDGPGVSVEIDHTSMVLAMKKIIEERDEIRLADSIIDQVQVVYEAEDVEAASDEMCQLNPVGCDAIVQVAVLGQVIYG